MEKISIFTFSIEKYLKSIKKPIKIVYSILIAFFSENIYISKNKYIQTKKNAFSDFLKKFLFRILKEYSF